MFRFLLLCCLALAACKPSQQTQLSGNYITKPQLGQILQKAKLKGAILLYDLAEDKYYSNDFTVANQGFLPASTFKIPNSIIALETGVVASDSFVFKWDGQKRQLASWEKDLTFAEAIKVSCVPCYQEIARNVGLERMRAYLDKFGYPGMVFDEQTLDKFWLEGPSRISLFEQIDFMRRFAGSMLPISKRTEQIVKKMLLHEHTDNYQLRGKTGWAMREGHNTGWFVGYVQLNDRQMFFATCVEPLPDFNMDNFAGIRKQVSLEALQLLGFGAH